MFTVLARRHFGDRALAGAILFAAATAADLYSGRLAFAFGALPALGAVLALDSRRTVTACLLGVVSALCSPVAALFAALVAGGYVLGGVILALEDPTACAAGPRHRPSDRSAAIAALPGMAVIVAALAPVLLISWIFPQGGSEPFAFTTMLPLVGISVIALVLMPREQVRLRAGVALYAVATLALYLIPTPIGSNIARMGTFAALPLVALVCWGRRPRLLALVFVPLLYVGWSPSVRDGIAGQRRQHRVDRVLPAAAAVPGPPGGGAGHVAVPDRDPVHLVSLGGVRDRHPVLARPRLGAPAGHPLQPHLLRRPADRRHLQAVAARQRGAIRRDFQRQPRLLGPGRGQVDRFTGSRTCTRYSDRGTGGSTGSPTQLRSSRRRPCCSG